MNYRGRILCLLLFVIRRGISASRVLYFPRIMSFFTMKFSEQCVGGSSNPSLIVTHDHPQVTAVEFPVVEDVNLVFRSNSRTISNIFVCKIFS